MENNYDFSGWATRANMRCTDGRIIDKDAFKECDGMVVPLVWNHRQTDPENVLGKVLLKHRDEGMYGYGCFNDTPNGKLAKEQVRHKDLTRLSIFANQLLEHADHRVMKGVIQEVSLVIAAANPGAYIDSVLCHNDDGSPVVDRTQGIIFTDVSIVLAHSDEEEAPKEQTTSEPEKEKPKEESVQDVFNSMTDKQKVVTMAIVDEVMRMKSTTQEETGEKKEDNDMKHNVFDQNNTNNTKPDNELTHADGAKIVELAKSFGGGSLRAAAETYAAQNNKELKHGDLGFNSISTLFPDYKDVRPGAPELLTTDQGWISKVLSKVHKSPISRIRTRQADARDISDRRARGYKKGSQKVDAGNLSLLSRTTDPVTVYIRSKLDRDDIIDIVDFDVVGYMYNSDRMNLNEELARQIMIGDGRSGDDAIDPTKIRPIWTDDELYTLHRDVDVEAMRVRMNGTNAAANFGENYLYAEAVIESLLYAREKYKGSGSPDFYCTPHLVNVMLLARDLNGRRIYDNVNELKAALNVSEIITVEQFEGQTRAADGKTKKLLGIMVNLGDYSLGATKGGEITHFTNFDINFNQEVSLLETRCSGANTRVMSAIALEEDVTPGSAEKMG